MNTKILPKTTTSKNLIAMAATLVFFTVFITMNGCTRIVKMQPTSGPPGTPVCLKCDGLWGSPTNYAVKWDGETICEPFSGTFVVPTDATPGEHKVTLVDKVDMAECNLIFPLIRLRHDTEIFTITAPYAYNEEYSRIPTR